MDVKKATSKIISKCESTFISEKGSITDLTQVLEETKKVIESNNPKSLLVAKYKDHARSLEKNPSSAMKLLGKMMMGLAVIILGASLAMACTGFGLPVAAAVGISSLGLFATGVYLNNMGSKGNKDDTALINDEGSSDLPTELYSSNPSQNLYGL